MALDSPASFSNEEASDEAAVGAAFERLQRSGGIAARGVRSVIDESWRRCFRAGLDPRPVRARPISASAAKRNPSARDRELLEASEAVMVQAREALAGCGTILILADATGVIVRMEGDDTAVAAASRIGLTQGSDWSEASRGTNALGTALYLGDHMRVHGAEHYCLPSREFTCSANVVRDPVDGAVLGALCVAGPSDASDPHLHPLVLASAARVGLVLAQREEVRREQLLEYALSMLSRRATTGLMLFDRRGRLVTQDARARAALTGLGVVDDAQAPARIEALDIHVGKHAADGALPFWLRDEWLEEVLVGEDRIGTIVKLPAALQPPPSGEGGLPRYKMRRVMAFVEARISEAITLDDLARVAGISRFHFHRQFRRALGVTPHDYVMRTRIERAKLLLLDSDLTVGEVAGAVGFLDQSHFSNIFRKVVSMTPRAFRNSMSA
jgi:sigma-54 dependent transcriptional regulator, acetoin dehydrogenase operon transcriptional activator AcoR